MSDLNLNLRFQDISILSFIAISLEEKGLKPTGLWDRVLGRAIIQFKIQNNLLNAADLKDERRLAVAEEYLEQLYHLNLRKDPADNILFGSFAQQTRVAIRDLVIISELEEISIEELGNPEMLAYVENKLKTTLYPNLNFNIDPALEILEGPWKEETEQVIDQLVS